MKNTRPIWRSLRPVLLAAAAATSWLALSAPAATADDTAETAPLVSSSSSSQPAPSGLSADIAFPAALPKLQPALGVVAAGADGLLRGVPAGTALAAANPIGTLTDPVATLADTVLGAASATVQPVTGTVNEVLDPVVNPIADRGVRPLPSPIPGVGSGLPGVLDGGASTPGGSPSAVPSGDRGEGDGEETLPSSAGILADPTAQSTTTGPSSQAVGAAVSGSRGAFESPAAVAGSAPPESPAEGDLDAYFHPVPAVPGSGAAGSANSGGGPAAPAWLSDHQIMIPSPPASPVRGAVLRAPSPVSFEPGSSPD